MKITKKLLPNTQIDVSIIVPIFNREHKIKELLDHLLASTYNLEKVEVILIDDLSTDRSVEVIKPYIREFPNIILGERETNSGGASVPRNEAMELSSGKWILFIDSDDYITEHAIADAMEVAYTDEQVDMICMPYFRSENSTRSISRSAFSYTETVTGLNFTETKLYNTLNVIGKFIKSDLILNNHITFPEDIRVREDNWFLMQVYSIVKNIAILGNKKNYYFYEQQDDVALSNNGAPPRDAVKIYLAVYDFIMKNDTIEQNKKLDLLSIYLNRYTNMIKRGKYAPVKFFEHTKPSLKAMENNRHIDTNAKEFIHDLFAGKYDIKN